MQTSTNRLVVNFSKHINWLQIALLTFVASAFSSQSTPQLWTVILYFVIALTALTAVVIFMSHRYMHKVVERKTLVLTIVACTILAVMITANFVISLFYINKRQPDYLTSIQLFFLWGSLWLDSYLTKGNYRINIISKIALEQTDAQKQLDTAGTLFAAQMNGKHQRQLSASMLCRLAVLCVFVTVISNYLFDLPLTTALCTFVPIATLCLAVCVFASICIIKHNENKQQSITWIIMIVLSIACLQVGALLVNSQSLRWLGATLFAVYVVLVAVQILILFLHDRKIYHSVRQQLCKLLPTTATQQLEDNHAQE